MTTLTNAPPTVPQPLSPDLNSPFDRDKFLLKQKHLSLTEKYAIFDERDQQVLFVKREAHHLRTILAFFAGLAAAIIIGAAFIVPAVALDHDVWSPVLVISGLVLALAAMITLMIWLSPKRNIGFFTDQTMHTEILRVFQDQKFFLINRTFTVADADLNLLGWFRKNYLYNIFRKRWYVYGPEGELVCVCMEDSIMRSIIRRVFRDYAIFMRTNFILLGSDFQTKLGEFNRKLTLFDKYVLDVTPDAQRKLDRRLAVALGVLLDTGEKR